MPSRLSISAFALAAVLLSGCVRYAPKPLDPEQELKVLRSREVSGVVVQRATLGSHPNGESAFDPSDGLNEAEVVSVALTLSPDLQAKRQAVGEAESALVAARLWPNPEVSVGWRAGIGGTSGYSVDADAIFELLRPGERSARKAAAVARVGVVRAEIASAEFETVAKVRVQRLRVLAAEQVVALLDEELKVRERGLDLVRRQRELGEGSQLEVATTELEVAEVRRELRKARAEVESERLGLNRLLGLPSEYDLRLTESGKPLAFTVYDDVADAEVERRILAGRPELASAAAGYREAEAELHLAVMGQYPRLGIGPAYERELEGDNALGLGLSLELPVFNRNQAEIAEKRAQRGRRRAEYVALLHGLRTDALAARSSLRQAAQEVEAQEKEVLPLIRRTEELTERAFRIRELSAIELTTAKQRALRARREYLEALVRHGTAVIELETATGMRLSEAAPPTAPRPQPATAPATPPDP